MKTITYENEEYRVFNNLYAVSKSGKVLRNFTPAELRIKDGYFFAGAYRVHRMIAECWVEGFVSKNHVHHINEDRLDNRVENLMLTSPETHILNHPETLAALLKSHTGIHKSEETKEKLRVANTGKKRSEETKEKIRLARTGKTLSAEHKAKIAAGAKKHFSNPENLEKYRASLKTRKHHPHTILLAQAAQRRSCEIDGTVYESMDYASRVTGIKSGTIRRRIFSKNFATYRFVDK